MILVLVSFLIGVLTILNAILRPHPEFMLLVMVKDLAIGSLFIGLGVISFKNFVQSSRKLHNETLLL